MQQITGQILGRYQIEQLLGEGVLGNIYRGHDINLERAVAVKVLKPTVASQPDFAARFAQVTRAAVRLDHAGISRVFDFGIADNTPYMVLELLTGPTLAGLLAAMRTTQHWLSLPEALYLVQQVGQALSYAHQHSDLRRRVEPAKIMFKPDIMHEAKSGTFPYQPVLIDLGLEALLAPAFVMQNRPTLNDLAYLSPEEVLGEAIDQRSDVYALGVLLYDLVVGQPPFQAATTAEAVDMHLNQKLLTPRTLQPALPTALAAMIEKAMHPTPGERYGVVRELVDALTALTTSGLPVIVPPAASAGAISIQAQYEQNRQTASVATPIEVNPGSPLDQTVAQGQAAPVIPDRIQLTTPDNLTRVVEITKPILTVGRTPDNDLVLNDARVSRKHIRLELEAGNYRIVDLNSANGTFVNKVRLPPGDNAVWTDDITLRIGDHHLRLLRGQPSGLDKSDGGAVKVPLPDRDMVYIESLGIEVDRERILTSADGITVSLLLMEDKLRIEPGSRASLSLVLLNQTNEPAIFTVKVDELPTAWFTLNPAQCELQPGEQRQVLLEIEPPRTPQSRAGLYALRIEVRSGQSTTQSVRADVKLTVNAYAKFRLELPPQPAQVGEALHVELENQGNSLQLFKFLWWDPQKELTFELDQAELKILPGESGSIEVTAALRKRRWLGATKLHRIIMQISPEYGAVQHKHAEMISRGRISVG